MLKSVNTYTNRTFLKSLKLTNAEIHALKNGERITYIAHCPVPLHSYLMQIVKCFTEVKQTQI